MSDGEQAAVKFRRATDRWSTLFMVGATILAWTLFGRVAYSGDGLLAATTYLPAAAIMTIATVGMGRQATKVWRR